MTITDHEVSRLPLAAAKNELLQEILATELRDDAVLAPERRRLPGWAVAGTAAAAVGLVIAVPAGIGVLGEGGGGGVAADPTATLSATVSASPSPSTAPTQTPTVPAPPAVPGGLYAVVALPGWRLTDAYGDGSSLDLSFAGPGGQSLNVTAYPASAHSDYVADRADDDTIGDRGSLGVLGRPARIFDYSTNDHEALRQPEGQRFLGFRGSGLSEQEFAEALAGLVQTDAAGFAAYAPGEVRGPVEVEEDMPELLRGVDLPPGFDTATIRLTGFNDDYQTRAQIAGAIGCAWLGYADRGPRARELAIAAFDASRHWQLFDGMAEEGDYPEVFWSTADSLRDEPETPASEWSPGLCS